MSTENVVQMPDALERLAAKINAEHDAFRSGISDSVKHAIAAGELLIEAKSKVRHGEWLPWVAKHCSFAARTASLYISVAKNKAAVERQIGNAVADLSLREGIALLKKIAGGQDDELPSEPEPALTKRNHGRPRRERHDRADEAIADLKAEGKPVTENEVHRRSGVSPSTVHTAVAVERAKQEALETASEEALAQAAQAALPKTTKDKFDLALKHALKRLEQEFEERVRQRSQENDEKLWKPYYNEKLKFYEAVVAGRDGVFTKAEYNKILFACHSDHVAKLGPETIRQHDEAFILFRDAEIKLVDEDESPQMSDRPWTLADLDRRREEVKAARAARRAAKKKP